MIAITKLMLKVWKSFWVSILFAMVKHTAITFIVIKIRLCRIRTENITSNLQIAWIPRPTNLLQNVKSFDHGKLLISLKE